MPKQPELRSADLLRLVANLEFDPTQVRLKSYKPNKPRRAELVLEGEFTVIRWDREVWFSVMVGETSHRVGVCVAYRAYPASDPRGVHVVAVATDLGTQDALLQARPHGMVEQLALHLVTGRTAGSDVPDLVEEWKRWVNDRDQAVEKILRRLDSDVTPDPICEIVMDDDGSRIAEVTATLALPGIAPEQMTVTLTLRPVEYGDGQNRAGRVVLEIEGQYPPVAPDDLRPSAETPARKLAKRVFHRFLDQLQSTNPSAPIAEAS